MEGLPNEVWYFFASVAGGSVSLAHLQSLTRWKQIGAVIAGTLTAVFCAPMVAEYFSLTTKATAGLHFFISLGGLMITGGLFSLATTFQNKPLEGLINILSLLTKGKGNG